jgi:hypothetical protein
MSGLHQTGFIWFVALPIPGGWYLSAPCRISLSAEMALQASIGTHYIGKSGPG